MPGIVVSLSEALAVSGTPLAESYVWAILNQSAVYFNKITKGRQKDLCNFVHVLKKKKMIKIIYTVLAKMPDSEKKNEQYVL